MSYWKNYWNNTALDKSLLNQVQRNSNKKDDGLLLVETHLVELLNLSNSDTLLDVCCGNGLITNRLSKHCSTVLGIDFSPLLIDIAIQNNTYSSVEYLVGDATTITKITNHKFDKIVLNFSFQYFNFDDGLRVVSEMKKLLKPNGLILLGDIPDQKRFWTYYNTLPKRFFYFKQWLFKQPKMGKFWSVQEMIKIAKQNNLKGTFLIQKEKLPHAHYRFDFLLENK
jgi:ubiquinone/menaquinone biosynthesis C-methylase UbiE